VHRSTTQAFASVALFLTAAMAGAQAVPAPQQSLPNRKFVGLDYSYAHVSYATDPWHLASASVGQRYNGGSFTARVNRARRFGLEGWQTEVDAYPRFGRHGYAYVNAGYSADALFPEWRLGAEYFASLPRAWEASLGFRHLRFEGDPVTLYTGSVAKYHGDDWFSLRPYVRKKPEGLSASASVTARRYGVDADNFMGARIGYGTTPADRLDPTELARTSALTADVHWSRSVRDRAIFTWTLTYEREELTRDAFRNRWELAPGMKVLF
jgi:YaiO family outer membrane protein